MAEDNFTSDKVSSLIATVIAIVIFIILFIKFVPVLYSFSMAGCEQEVMFRKNILGLSFGDVDFMQDMARWGWLSGFIPPLRQCSMPFNGYVINNSHYKSPDDACSGCGYEFKTKQEIIDIIIQSMINCWSTYSSGIDDSNGVLYYDKNPAPCSFIDLYLANETISIKNDILLEMKNGYTMAGKNKIYWNESLLVSDGFHRIFWKYTNALQQQSVSAGDSSTCYSNICSLSSISFDDSNFLESATGTCQSSCSASEYPFFQYDNALACHPYYTDCPPGGESSISITSASSRNTWHTLRLEFNCKSDIVEATVDGTSSTGQILVRNFDGVDSLHFWTNGASDLGWDVDDIVLFDSSGQQVYSQNFENIPYNQRPSPGWTFNPAVGNENRDAITSFYEGDAGQFLTFIDKDTNAETEATVDVPDLCSGSLELKMWPSSYEEYQCSVSAGGVAIQYASDGYWRLYIPPENVWAEDVLFGNTSLLFHYGDYLYYQEPPYFSTNVLAMPFRYLVVYGAGSVFGAFDFLFSEESWSDIGTQPFEDQYDNLWRDTRDWGGYTEPGDPYNPSGCPAEYSEENTDVCNFYACAYTSNVGSAFYGGDRIIACVFNDVFAGFPSS